MKKKIIWLTIIGVVLFLIIISSILYKNINKNQVYKGKGLITSSASFKTATVEIKDENNKVIGNSTIYSNIFWVDDSINIEYTKKGSELTVNKISAIFETRKDLAQIISHIGSDVTMRKYREIIKGSYIDSELVKKNNIVKIDSFLAMPQILSNQEYKLGIDPEEFIEIKGYSLTIFKKTTVTLNVDEDFEILEFDNIKGNKKQDIKYQIENNDIKFDSIGEGLYLLKLQFTNGDIINYIFG